MAISKCGQACAKFVTIVLLASLTLSCGRTSDSSDSSNLNQFFKNSERRNATETEKRQVVKLSSGCAAFHVANSAGKAFFASARHCVNRSATAWCKNGGGFKDNRGQSGTCKSLVAADTNHDIFVFEANYDASNASDVALSLAASVAPIGARLVMIGYPTDKFRQAALTTTENCWVLKTQVASPHSDLKDRSSRHNCTTYSGNSGGPMIKEGTLVAVGLPFTYAPNDYVLRDEANLSTSSYLAEMADFVSIHRAKLEAAGVSIAE